MLIRTLTRAAGRLSFMPGDELELPDAEAMDLVNAGCAIVVRQVSAIIEPEIQDQNEEQATEKKKRK